MDYNFSKRIRQILGLFLLFALVIICKLFWVQIIRNDLYSQKSENQYSNSVSNIFDRGSIFFESKDGVKIGAATVKEGYILAISPKILKNANSVFDTLSEYIKIDKETFIEKANKTDDPYEVSEERCIEIIKAKRISDGAKAEISKHFPKTLGEYEKGEVVVNIGRYGPYITHNKSNFPVPKAQDLLVLTLEEAIEYIKGNKKKSAEKSLKEFPENANVKVLSGRYGAYIKIGKDNFKIPAEKEAKDLTLSDCLKIAEESGKTIKNTTTKKAATKKPAKTTAKKK